MNELFPEPKPEFDTDNNKKYKLKTIKDGTVYVKKTEDYLLELYYLVFWKSYLEEKNTWESFSAIMHLQKIISTFHKNQPKKPMATLSLLDFAPLMAKLSVKLVKPSAKQKQNRLIDSTK